MRMCTVHPWLFPKPLKLGHEVGMKYGHIPQNHLTVHHKHTQNISKLSHKISMGQNTDGYASLRNLTKKILMDSILGLALLLETIERENCYLSAKSDTPVAEEATESYGDHFTKLK